MRIAVIFLLPANNVSRNCNPTNPEINIHRLITIKIGVNNSGFLVPNKKSIVEIEKEEDLLRLKEFFAPTMRRLGYLADE